MISSYRNNILICVVTLFTSVFASQKAFALLDFQALYGMKTGKFSGDLDGDDSKAQQMKFAVHINPIPLPMVTFGLGLSFSLDTYDVDSQQGINVVEDSVSIAAPFKDLSGYTLGPEIFLGVNIPGTDLMPYLRMTYGVSLITATSDVSTQATSGGQIVTQDDVDLAMAGTGIHTAIGLGYSPIPLFSILVEYEFGEDTLITPEVNETVTIPELEGKLATTSILIGAQLGI